MIALLSFARNHFLWWIPIWPFGFACHLMCSGPLKAWLANANTVSPRLAIFHHQIEKAVRRIDDNRARWFTCFVAHHLRQELWCDFWALYLCRPIGHSHLLLTSWLKVGLYLLGGCVLHIAARLNCL